MLERPKKQRRRKPKGVYIDGIGLHQWSLPLEMAGGGMARLSLGDNNHAVLVTDQEIRISTKILTVLAMTLQEAFGQEGRIHSWPYSIAISATGFSSGSGSPAIPARTPSSSCSRG